MIVDILVLGLVNDLAHLGAWVKLVNRLVNDLTKRLSPWGAWGILSPLRKISLTGTGPPGRVGDTFFNRVVNSLTKQNALGGRG